MDGKYKSPLHEMASRTRTDFWNDSCSVEELTYAIEHGAVGATTNPAIVLGVLKKEMHLWRDRIVAMIAQNPAWSEVEVAWKLVEEMAANGAELLHPVFVREHERKGRISIQTNPQLYRNAEAIVDQAERFHGLAPNMQVKIPVTRAGVEAIEEATARGININATVCFSVAQAVEAAQAVERGLSRREAQGLDIASMSPVVTIMVGRLEDWLQILTARDGVTVHPAVIPWAGVACFKHAYGIFGQRKFRGRLLAAAYRHHLHWSELIGGDVTLTLPSPWQKQFNASRIEVKERMDDPVEPWILDELRRAFPDFVRATEPGGMTLAEFDAFGPTQRTLRSFISSYQDLLSVVRDFMVPDPDRKPMRG
ncbi:MAG: transaldolase [Deltaproteobacteria bacterium]|nr:transaldolase [Deltaproteobacteria bacterium]